MRRKLLYITFLIFCIIGIIGCSKEGSVTKTSPNIREQVIGTLQDDVHRILGGTVRKIVRLFAGEIYTFDNGTQMIFYYDNQMKVRLQLVQLKPSRLFDMKILISKRLESAGIAKCV